MSQVRPVTLNATKAGMTRLRIKGGASPETLYDLTNGFVNASKCPQQRPGLTWLFNFADPALGKGANAGITKGTVAFKGIVYTFSHIPLASGSSNFVILVLRHPTSNAIPLKAVHFAQPFMGYMYVVGEFNDGHVSHYWLQTPPVWKASTQYMDNDLVSPSVSTGYVYQAQRRLNPPAWTALLQYKVGDIVAPTTYDGSYFEVANVVGPGSLLTPPISRSGPVEPNWAAGGLRSGSITIEFSTASTPPTPTQGPSTPTPEPPSIQPGNRYNNRSGGFEKP